MNNPCEGCDGCGPNPGQRDLVDSGNCPSYQKYLGYQECQAEVKRRFHDAENVTEFAKWLEKGEGNG